MRLLALTVVIVLASCKSTRPNTSLQSAGDNQANNKVWAVAGYLPEAPTSKVWVTMKGRSIAAVGAEAPADVPDIARINTEALIFPGLVDLHGHVKYNVLPLWGEAKGQFLNRFEWRGKFPNYKKAVSFNMKALPAESICAAVRWAEIKALVGGVTAIQGIGGDAKCGEDFGVNNVDITGEYQNDIKIRGMTDIVDPGMMGNVFEKEIRPFMTQGATYDQAYGQFLAKYGIDRWLDQIKSTPASLSAGLAFMLGNGFSDKWDIAPEMEMDAAKLQATGEAGLKALLPTLELRSKTGGANPTLTALLSQAPFSLTGTKLTKQLDSMAGWLTAFAPIRPPVADSAAYDLLGKGGMLAFPSAYRRYINMFELSVRKSAAKYLDDPNALAIIAHIAEGGQRDRYNVQEYKYLQTFGLNRGGMVMIHAVGLNETDFRDAATNGLSVVWSPFSNLLLYGETMDISAARRAGVNIALGSDWSPTGSKTLLDEFKIAKRWIRVNSLRVTDKELVEMATVNAAKALRRERIIGAVQPGYQADLTLVLKKSDNPWTDLVDATEKDVVLVSVKGEPLYGEASLIRQFAATFDGPAQPEALPAVTPETCGMTKAMRFPFMAKLDREREADPARPAWRSVRAVMGELTTRFATYAADVQQTQPAMVPFLVKLDPMYRCEDPSYSQRFDAFVETEVPLNKQQRPTVRTQYQLKDDWNPLGEAETTPAD